MTLAELLDYKQAVIGSVESSLDVKCLYLLRELNYRIDVLERMRLVLITAPDSTDANVCLAHFRSALELIGEMLNAMKSEHKNKCTEYLKEADAVLKEYRPQQGQYKKDVKNVVVSCYNYWLTSREETICITNNKED